MSLWDNLKKFTQPYSDDEYDEYDDEVDTYEEEPQARPVRERRAPLFNLSSTDESSFGASSAPSAPTGTSAFSGQVVDIRNKQEVVLFRPTSFNDTSKAADDLRHRKAVIVNMENVDKAMARRVVDFLSGCVYALDGTVKKIAQSAYLFCPHNMDVVGDLETIQAEVESYV